jgi:hypothetical protein
MGEPKIRFPKWVEPPVHPVNTAPMMSDAELDELAADIKKHGLQEPIVYWRDNREAKNGSEGPFPTFLLDGRNRREALRRLGIEDPRKAKFGNLVATTVRFVDAIKQTFALGAGGKTSSKWEIEVDPATFHLSMNVHRRHLTPEQRRWEVKRLIARDPNASNKSIAREVGAGIKTVKAVRLEITGKARPTTAPAAHHRGHQSASDKVKCGNRQAGRRSSRHRRANKARSKRAP